MRIAAFVFLAVAIPSVVLAAAPQTFQDLANIIVTLLNSATVVLILAGLAVYFYGISINILKFGEGDKEKLKSYFFWGIIVLFVMVSIWGILHLLQDTLFGGNSFNATNGTLQQPTLQSSGSVPQFRE